MCANDRSAKAVVALIASWHCISPKEVRNSSAWSPPLVGSGDSKSIIRLLTVSFIKSRSLVSSVPLYSEMYYANIINITLFALSTAAYRPSIKSTCLLASSHKPMTLINPTSITLPLFRRYSHNQRHFIGLKRYYFLRPSLSFTALLWCGST
jgi:hypothetical protein